jgi:glycosyltransferase involved in cell wall biosynthesis
MAAALAQLLAEPDLRQRLCQAGYRQVKKFTWQGMARELVKLYPQLLSPSREKKG